MTPAGANENRDPHPTLEKLISFDRGQLAGEDLARIEAHVAGCAACCERLANLPENTLGQFLRQVGRDSTDNSTEKLVPGAAAADIRLLPAELADMPAALTDHPRYRIIERLGAGGMGIVFKAEHRLMERIVALKVVNPRLVDNPAAVGRFRQEARAAARLVHPFIVTAHDAEQAGDLHFLVMEFVSGESLDRLLRRDGRLSVGRTCSLMRDVALGLGHAHAQGMVHRDIKPGNLMLTDGGGVKILDFGLARFVSETLTVEGLTTSGMVVGTPDYIAPEQAADPRKADIRADLYSLGSTLYHLLTGQPPFPHGTVLQKLIAHRERFAAPVRQLCPEVPKALSDVIARLMEKEPANRYPNPSEVAQALAAFADAPAAASNPNAKTPIAQSSTKPFRGRRQIGWIIGAAALLLLGIGLLSLILRGTQPPTEQAALPSSRDENALAGGTRTEKSNAPATVPKTFIITSPAPPRSSPAKDDAKGRPLIAVRSRLPDTQKIRLEGKDRRDAMIAWFHEHNPEGKESALAKKWAADLSAVTTTDDDLHVILGPGLVRSKSIAFLSVFGDGFFAFELTSPEAARMRIDPSRSKLDSVKHNEPRTIQAEISNLRVVSGAAMPNGQEIRCSVAYKRLVPVTDDKLAVRVYRRVAGKGESSYFNLGGPLKAASGTLSFSANWENVVKDTENGPLIFFVELVSLTEPGKYKDLKIVSNTTAALVWIDP
jgi:serine/threonine protein kinase